MRGSGAGLLRGGSARGSGAGLGLRLGSGGRLLPGGSGGFSPGLLPGGGGGFWGLWGRQVSTTTASIVERPFALEDSNSFRCKV
jgi:hypothetical protein